jgi:hypothetical protein
MMGGRGMMGQQMYQYPQKSMLNPLNWGVWPWNWSLFGG